MISVVIPTLDEEENIESLLEEIDDVLEEEHEIIVVDDSEDSTAEKVRDTGTDAEVVSGGGRDIGYAIRRGLSEADGDVIVQMDADFSHPPEKLPDLVEAVRSGADVVVGSRYVEGGDRNDPLYRRIFPLLGSYLYRILLRSPVRDVTSGFKAYDIDSLETVQDPALPDGFHFQAASLMKLLEEKEVEEVPIDFRPRRDGEPKYSYRDLINNILLIGRLSLSKYEKFLKFGTVGFSGVLVNMSILYILTDLLGIYYMFSAAVAVESSIVSNFVLNELWTFVERGKEGLRNIFQRFLKFNTVSFSGLAVNLSMLWILTEFAGIYYLLSNLFAIAVVFLWNYFLNVRWTWRENQ